MTEVEICNLALAALGDATQISSLTDGSTRANQCALTFPACLDEFLSDDNWSWATKRTSLPVAADAPAFGYAYAYLMPSDFLRVVLFGDNTAKFKLERDANNNLVINSDVYGPVSFAYVARVNASDIPAKAAWALVYLLASKLAPSVGGDFQKSIELEKVYRRYLARAKGVNSGSGSNDGTPAYDTELSRLGWIDV